MKSLQMLVVNIKKILISSVNTIDSGFFKNEPSNYFAQTPFKSGFSKSMANNPEIN